MQAKVLTLHPRGLAGVSISTQKYTQMKEAIIVSLQTKGPQTFNDLLKLVEMHPKAKFEGSISWYFTVVKLDLEARGELKVQSSKKGMMVYLG